MIKISACIQVSNLKNLKQASTLHLLIDCTQAITFVTMIKIYAYLKALIRKLKMSTLHLLIWRIH